MTWRMGGAVDGMWTSLYSAQQNCTDAAGQLHNPIQSEWWITCETQDGRPQAFWASVDGRMQPYVQLCFSEFVNCMYATNANKCQQSCHFRISSHSFNLARTIANVSVCCYIFAVMVTLIVLWHGPTYGHRDLEYILGPCDVALCAASISIHAPWLWQYCCDSQSDFDAAQNLQNGNQ